MHVDPAQEQRLTDWAAIVREHGPLAYDTAWRILGNAGDTEDAVQDAFLNALGIQRRRAVRNWGALLRHLATCRALDLLRKRRRLAPLVPELQAPRSSQPEVVAVATESVALLRQALARLPDREAEVFALRYLGQLSNPEIAEALQITAGAVATALHKARLQLQALLPSTRDQRP
jgi:RNA polymerase sigma-70 factor (ECF subfamily)